MNYNKQTAIEEIKRIGRYGKVSQRSQHTEGTNEEVLKNTNLGHEKHQHPG